MANSRSLTPIGGLIDAALGKGREGFWATEVVTRDDGRQVRRTVTRPAKCDCGRAFTQLKLSDRFLKLARYEARRAGKQAAIDREIPDHFVPLFCPPCESKQLGMEARRAQYREPPAPPSYYEIDEREGLAAD